MNVLVAAAGAGVVLLAGLSASQAADCKGDTRQEHHVGNFNFVTSSWVEDVGTMRRYVSCVGNLDANSDLLVTWYIAGPFKSYVPSEESAETPRMRADTNTRAVAGCIQYGNSGERTPAEFLGTTQDDDENTKAGRCGASYGQAENVALAPLPEGGWSDHVRVFFPSDLNNPSATMLEVNGTIGIEPSDSGFQAFFRYAADRFRDRPEGQVNDVILRPVFPVESDKFLAAFFLDNKGGAPLLSKGAVTFAIKGNAANLWKPVPAYYEFVDKDNHLLAAIPMPLFGDPQ